jgi:hypothetical protein
LLYRSNMQDNNIGKIPTSAEIVDVPPSGSLLHPMRFRLNQSYLQVQQN